MTRILVLSGTPGVGKTTVAKYLENIIQAQVLSISELVKSLNLFDTWNNEKQTMIVDEEKARDALIERINQVKKNNDFDWLIIEGLMADIVADVSDIAIVLRLHPDIIMQRLQKKGYEQNKINENVQSEILGTCTYHMKEARGDDFMDIDTTGKTIMDIANIVLALVSGTISKDAFRPGLIDWIARGDLDPRSYF